MASIRIEIKINGKLVSVKEISVDKPTTGLARFNKWKTSVMNTISNINLQALFEDWK